MLIRIKNAIKRKKQTNRKSISLREHRTSEQIRNNGIKREKPAIRERTIKNFAVPVPQPGKRLTKKELFFSRAAARVFSGTP